MKTAKGIPCSETRHTLKAEKNKIAFRFVSDDGNTPSNCTVRIGDTDSLTGEPITDMTFFKEYYKMIDHEIYTYWKDRRPALTPEEKKQRDEKKNAFAVSFEKRYGYRPSDADLRWMTDDFMSERYCSSIEWYRDQEGNPESDRIPGLSIPCEDPFDADEPDDILRLREFASTLTGRMADIYEWLIVKYAGGREKLSLKTIADKWGISITQAYKDKDKLLKKLRKYIERS